MKKFTIKLRTCLYGLSCVFLVAFSIPYDIAEETLFVQKMFKEHYDEIAIKPALKKYELNVTNTGFCRYRRFYANGKVEYFSFNLCKFKDIDYLGTDKTGQLILRTLGDDVIVQTYNDRQGDVDSMASHMSIPLKNVEAEQLSALAERLARMNAHLLVQK
jgi:hypothetical protein